ncbi:hypothetical protein [uncultured Tenacibaculum sp.]|uniref:hypothetical protein n=1 Tax=uncultured Tenacibaculum sp. TaxID=174713 RepID=UPI00262DAB7D|nr:hypothetical protein [uncultured Tenacibaculum sp.]
MKNVLKVVVLVLTLSFISCGNNEEIATTDGQVITTDQYSIDKSDSRTSEGGGVDTPDMDED